MELHNVWYVIVTIFWTGFFVLEGFDFGVGMLHTVVGKTDAERNAAVSTIGPFWDGNEVWLIVAGAATFAAFPAWYATMFSSLYLALFMILLALIVRGVSFEFRHRVAAPRWHAVWKWALTIGSALIPLLIGVGLGDLLHGLPIDKGQEYTGNFWDLLTGYGLWVGITFLSLSLLSGATFLVLKTTGDLRARARRVAGRSAWVALVAVVVFAVWTQVESSGSSDIPGPLLVGAVLAVVAAAWAVSADHEGWAFTASSLAMGLAVSSLFVNLYPNVMVSSTNSAYNLTVSGTASGEYALQVMTVVAVLFFPIVLAYQAWSYHTFRKRVSAPAVGVDPAPAPQADVVEG